MAMQRGDEMVTRVCGYSLECTVHGGATSDKITVTRWSPGGDSVQGVRIFTTFYSNRWYNECHWASLERWVPRFEVAKHSIYGRPPGVYMYDAGIEGIPIRLNLVFCHPNADTRRWVADRQHTHVERGKNGVAPVVFTEALELSGVSCSTGEGERRRGIWAMMFLERDLVRLGLVGDKYSRLKPDLQDVTTASKEERKTSFSGSMFWKAVLSAAHATALSVFFSCRCTLPVGAPNTPPTGRALPVPVFRYIPGSSTDLSAENSNKVRTDFGDGPRHFWDFEKCKNAAIVWMDKVDNAHTV
ncbi:hypothetical protein Bbelb_039800 [Branchiostoma belcheri]|nr:hypothetical protein Bbelb_039800 [Branchiostoma belcheri]